MKGFIKTTVLCILLALLMSLCAGASGIMQGEEIKEMISEKIIPVIAGVLTSLVALLGTLKSIFKSLKELKGAKDSLESTQGEIKEQSTREFCQIKEKYDELKTLLADVPQLKTELDALAYSLFELSEQMARLSKLSAIGFCQNPEIITSGKGKEITLLAQQNQKEVAHEEN